MSGVHVQVVDLAAQQVYAAGGLRQYPHPARCKQRVLGLHFTDLQYRFGDAHFQCPSAFAVRVFRFAITVDRQVAQPGRACTAIKFQGKRAVRIDTETHRAQGEAGFEVGDDALRAITTVHTTVFSIAVPVVITQQHVEVAVFDNPLGCRLVGYQWCCLRHVLQACGCRQGQQAFSQITHFNLPESIKSGQEGPAGRSFVKRGSCLESSVGARHKALRLDGIRSVCAVLPTLQPE